MEGVCRFCGKRNSAVTGGVDGGWKRQCLECGATTSRHGSTGEADEEWNDEDGPMGRAMHQGFMDGVDFVGRYLLYEAGELFKRGDERAADYRALAELLRREAKNGCANLLKMNLKGA